MFFSFFTRPFRKKVPAAPTVAPRVSLPIVTNTATANPGIKNIGMKDFLAEVVNADGPVLVDFWAEGCVPCRMVSALLNQYPKRKIVKVNVGEEHELGRLFQIEVVPTLMLFKGKKLVGKIVGVPSKQDLDKLFLSAN